ncbi:MAG: hypothetical protein NTX59_10095 [Elusimicrobia bacterium]|nr:hypothetical protein [Elusimicrobiota bacterium]
MPKKKKVLIMEFTIQVYSDGEIFWDAFDKFLFWKLNQKPKEGFLPYVRKLHRLQNEAEKSLK